MSREKNEQKLLDEEKIKSTVVENPGLRKRIITMPRRVRQIAGIYGITKGSALEIIHYQELCDFTISLSHVLENFKDSALLQQPCICINFNKNLYDQPFSGEQKEKSVDFEVKDTTYSSKDESPSILNQYQKLQLMEDSGKPEERLVVRGMCGIDGKLANSDALIYKVFRQKLLNIIAKFKDQDFLRLDCVYVFFNPYNYSEIKPSSSAAKMPATSNADVEEVGKATSPLYKWGSVVLSKENIERLEEGMFMQENKEYLYSKDGCNFSAIDSHPMAYIIAFFGPSGCGKTRLAHTIADRLGLKIIETSYGEIDHSLVGQGAKNIRGLFVKAARENALLFIDEADSLLSTRPIQMQQSSDYHVSSLRSELIIALNKFPGVVIFATNNEQTYDKAFISRISVNIEIPLPNEELLERIWRQKLPCEIELASDVDFKKLAQISHGLSGRDILVLAKKAVITAKRRDLTAKVCFENFSEVINRHRKQLIQKKRMPMELKVLQGKEKPDQEELKCEIQHQRN